MTVPRGELLFAALHVVRSRHYAATRERWHSCEGTHALLPLVCVCEYPGRGASPLRNLFCWWTPRTRGDARRDGCDPLNHKSGVWQAVLLYGRTVWNVECDRRDVLSTVRADLVP